LVDIWEGFLDMTTEDYVLVVEDDDLIRESMVSFLQMEGYRVLSASNGKEGLKLVEEGSKPICLVFLDLMMPIMNGWEFLKELEQLRESRNPKVVIVTALSEDRIEDLKNSFPLLVKPFGLEQLKNHVDRFCAHAISS